MILFETSGTVEQTQRLLRHAMMASQKRSIIMACYIYVYIYIYCFNPHVTEKEKSYKQRVVFSLHRFELVGGDLRIGFNRPKLDSSYPPQE